MTRPTTVREEIQQTRPFSSPAEEAAVGLVLTSDLLVRWESAIIGSYGITYQQYNVLRILRGSHPGTLQTLEIAERMIEKAPGITRLLDRLELKRLVTRQRSTDDRRCVLCSITDEGLELLGRLDGPVRESARAAFSRLPERQQLEFIRRLDEIRAAVRAAPAPSEPQPRADDRVATQGDPP